MPQLDSLERVFETDLKDIYDAEKRLTKALPKMVRAAQSKELKDALKEHLEVTTQQVARVEQIFQSVGIRAAGKPCAGMKGLIEEGQEAIDTQGSEPFTDLALIGAARRVEHYEIAAYLSLRDLATELYDGDVSELINRNLEEEQTADQTLASLAQELMSGASDSGDEEDAEDTEMEEDEEEEEDEK